jgi:hypothetical protein
VGIGIDELPDDKSDPSADFNIEGGPVRFKEIPAWEDLKGSGNLNRNLVLSDLTQQTRPCRPFVYVNVRLGPTAPK